jgi:hypothetical protein
MPQQLPDPPWYSGCRHLLSRLSSQRCHKLEMIWSLVTLQASFTHLKHSALEHACCQLECTSLLLPSIHCTKLRLVPRYISCLDMSSKTTRDDTDISLCTLFGMWSDCICDVALAFIPYQKMPVKASPMPEKPNSSSIIHSSTHFCYMLPLFQSSSAIGWTPLKTTYGFNFHPSAMAANTRQWNDLCHAQECGWISPALDTVVSPGISIHSVVHIAKEYCLRCRSFPVLMMNPTTCVINGAT